jgi:hypothetical protein
MPGLRDARLTATNPRDGLVPVVLVDAPGRDRSDWLCRETTLTAPRPIQAWQRRSWIDPQFRACTHLLAPEVCQVSTEGASCGHLVLRLLAGLAHRRPAIEPLHEEAGGMLGWVQAPE